MTRFLSPMRGESGSANRQTTTWPLSTVIAAWFRSRIQSSRLRAGLQWNIPVESYFISVFSKSKSFAWSSAIPIWRPPLLLTFAPPDARLVGLESSNLTLFILLELASWNLAKLSHGRVQRAELKYEVYSKSIGF